MTIPGTVNGIVKAVEGKASQAVKEISSRGGSLTNIDIIDIRHDAVQINLKEEILESLRPQNGPKLMPTLILYDERGLQLFEEITYLDQYYLTNAEIDVLERSAGSIAEAIPAGSMIIELGSGNLRKVSILLNALEQAGKAVDYYALDLSLKELKRTLEQVPSFEHVKCHGLHGTYDDGLDWLKIPENCSKPKCVMSLGSSIGNFQRHEAASFLRGFQEVLSPTDSMLIGLDGTNDPNKVYHAYNDRDGTTHSFILNGLLHANKILGEDAFNLKDWKVIGEYVYDDEGGRHQAFYSPLSDLHYQDIHFKAGERIRVEQSLKYSPEGTGRLFAGAGLSEIERWSASSDDYNMHLLKKQKVAFDFNPDVYAGFTVPTLEDWKGLWSVWDLVTQGMIPHEELYDKPITLRNAVIFYLGHIPTFMEVQLKKVSDLPPCEPSHYPKIFERGIDPDVDHPEQCHSHSEIPDEWPPLNEILSYQQQVRAKVETLCKRQDNPREINRAIWLGFEHEAMHLETLLYMLLQSNKTLPPTTSKPDFEGDAAIAEAARVSNQWFKIPKQTITLGLDDPEDNSNGNVHFGWDNEKPSRKTPVPAFEAQARAVTNGEYAHYMEQTGSSESPASWADDSVSPINGQANGSSNGDPNGYSTPASVTKTFLAGKSVRTVYGLVPLKYALDWPVSASYDELLGCASWMGGRIPTVEEARSIYQYVDHFKIKEAEQKLSKTVPAVNGHLVNDGVEESPPSQALKNGKSSGELFASLDGANVGFKNWHPIAVTANGNKLGGQADMGGVWEWTSSPLSKHDGFEPMPLYPNYTADFFDDKHNVVLGGSWATHPRIAGRKTFINWYQRNYRYTWAGARLVRDL